MTSVFITGSTGYIGRALTGALEIAGYHVHRCPWRLEDIPEGAIDSDVVIHLAARGGGTRHRPRTPHAATRDIWCTNVEGTERLLAGIAHDRTRLIFLSSNAVYGALPSREPEGQAIVTENLSPHPPTPYARSKAEAEDRIRNTRHHWVILRPCGVFGHNGFGDFGNAFLNPVITEGLASGTIRLWGGEQLTDVVALGSVTSAIEMLCRRGSVVGTFNVAGPLVPLRDLFACVAQAIRSRTGRCAVLEQPIEHPIPPVLSPDRLQDTLGWQPAPHRRTIPTLVTERAARQYR